MKRKESPAERFVRVGWHDLPPDLFGVVDIHDFDGTEHYNRFLDGTKNLGDLQKGLRSLSPLADDALAIALAMDDRDFFDFKLQLACERRLARTGESSSLPSHLQTLLVPSRFMQAALLVDELLAPLGTILFRILQEETLEQSP